MQRVAFICVHNSCRSQMAEALGRHLAADAFESFSAGMQKSARINPDAVRLMKALCHIDNECLNLRALSRIITGKEQPPSKHVWRKSDV